jgi:proteic killer suppression protein
MIRGFGNQLAEDLYYDRKTKATRSFPPELRRIARRKILFLHDAAELRDLRSPPGNKLEALRGDRNGSHSIRINDQWRVVFVWKGSDAYEVEVVDYHR